LNATHQARGRGGFLFATPPGELHAFGIALAAILAATERFPVNNLGPNVPADEVIRAAGHLGVGCVVVGAPRSTPGARSARAFLAELEGKLPPSIALCVGGPAEYAACASTRAHHVSTLPDFVELLETWR
jgi:cobalamin-dependent methionine synthase I